MDPVTWDPPIPCPSCAQGMAKRALPNHDGAAVCLDLCYPCHAIWFDRTESVRLAPRGVIELFRDIHARRDEPRNALPERLRCPRCSVTLALTSQQARLDYVRERLRLLYVGITRARKELVITWNSGRKGDQAPAKALGALYQYWRDKGYESA